MKPRELMTLALRVLAVFIASRAFVYLAEFATFWAMPSDQLPIPLTPLSSVLLLGPFIIAIVVWLLAPLLSRLATRGMVIDETSIRLDLPNMVSATFATVGILVFLLTLPDLVAVIMQMNGSPHQKVGQVMVSALVANILKCLLGLVLLLGAKPLSRFLFWLRYAGTNA